jgi:hypothetical protein
MIARPPRRVVTSASLCCWVAEVGIGIPERAVFPVKHCKDAANSSLQMAPV